MPTLPDLNSLVVILAIAAIVPLVLGLTRLPIAGAVLLLGCGVLFGPEALSWITIDQTTEFLSEMGLAMLFFVAGMELDTRSLRATPGKLAFLGWGTSLILSLIIVGVLDSLSLVDDHLAVAIVLTSTALGTLLPQFRDGNEVSKPFGKFFMAAGAVGEMGPVIAVAALLGTTTGSPAALAILVFGVLVLALSRLPQRFLHPRILTVVHRDYRSSSQTGVRLALFLLVVLVALAGNLGLDIVLGAFFAGMIVRTATPVTAESALEMRIEAVAFGVFVPIFFIVSGARIDLTSIIENPFPLIAYFILLIVIRAIPQYVLYRRHIPDRWERGRFSMLVATGLPVIVAVTSVQMEAGLMGSDQAAALVGAGALSVLVFPIIARLMQKRVVNSINDDEKSRSTQSP